MPEPSAVSADPYVSVLLCESNDISPLDFYLNLEGNLAKLGELLSAMRKFYSEMDELKSRIHCIPSSEIRVGLPCALLSKDRAHRVVVMETSQNLAATESKVKVRFVDHGRSCRVDTSILR